MSDDERLNLRDLPPVEPIPAPPGRFSQTLMRHHDRCPRAAYLYVKHHGGTPAHELDRGTAAHLVFEKAERAMVEQGASFDVEGTLEAAQIDPDTVKVLVNEVRRERPDLALSVAEWDDVRIMAYHVAVGFSVDPAKVVAIERKFVLPAGPWELSGKIDLALIDPRSGDVAEVDDWKSSPNVPDQETFEDAYQTKFYGVQLVWGHPVEKVGGEERREPPIGERVQWVRLRELYPMHLRKDGKGIVDRSTVVSRLQLSEWREDIEEAAHLVARRFGLTDEPDVAWRFPALPGSHCSQCPAQTECPLPAHLRRWAGAINAPEQAEEAARWLEVLDARRKATREEIKRFAAAHSITVRAGRDIVYEFGDQEKRTVDVDAMAAGAWRAAHFGEPFEPEDYIKRSRSTPFVRRRLSPVEVGELATEEDQDAGAGADDLDARFGVDPPF